MRVDLFCYRLTRVTEYSCNLGCMQKRNARLVELSDICVCYLNEKRSNGGTAQTVRMAKKGGVDVVNLF